MYGLLQSKADESLWFIRERVAEEYQTVVGLLVVYVDDLAVFFGNYNLPSFYPINSEQMANFDSYMVWRGTGHVLWCRDCAYRARL